MEKVTKGKLSSLNKLCIKGQHCFKRSTNLILVCQQYPFFILLRMLTVKLYCLWEQVALFIVWKYFFCTVSCKLPYDICSFFLLYPNQKVEFQMHQQVCYQCRESNWKGEEDKMHPKSWALSPSWREGESNIVPDLTFSGYDGCSCISLLFGSTLSSSLSLSTYLLASHPAMGVPHWIERESNGARMRQ